MVFLEHFIARQRQNAFLWVPVLIGTGIGLYFSLQIEPSGITGLVVLGLCLAAAGIVLVLQRGVTPALILAIGFMLVAAGWNIAKLRTVLVFAPAITKSMAPVMVEGVIVSLDALDEKRGTRVILKNPVIEDLSPEQTPHFIRISIRKDDGLKPGQHIRVLAGLNPPSPPVMPGGFDFQRHMYFLRIGALGFAYKAPEIIPQRPGDTAGGMSRWIETFRQKHALHVREVVQEPEASIVSALLLGERAGIPEDTWQDIRAAGLAHVISISGLHIGLIAGGIFFFTRLGMAMVPRFALYHPIKKYAAVLALLGCTFYAVMVGLSVPTLRSVIMTGLALTAIMFDRSPFSMRLVALSALIILLSTPESLTGPSFQMSFGAVAALIFFYDETRNFWSRINSKASWWKKPVIYVGGICLTSLIATIATAPFTLYHFQQFPIYSVIGNALALPVVGFVVMPAAVVAYILMPFGLDGWALQAMGWGIGIMLDISRWIAGWPQASLSLPAWPLAALVSFTLAGLSLMVLKGRSRWIFILPLVLGLVFVVSHKNPDIVVAQSAKLIMVRLSEDEIVLNTRKTERFMAENWIRAMGLEPGRTGVFPKEGQMESGGNTLSCDLYGCRLNLHGRKIALSFDPRAVAEDCGQVDLLISTKPVKGCRGENVIDRWDLKNHGTHAVWVTAQGLRIKTVEGERGLRPWTTGLRQY